MKQKIGLFLDFDASGGGNFQYNQTMIDAVAALPCERYDKLFAYTSESWLKYLPTDLPSLRVYSGFLGRALPVAWTRAAFPMRPWRALSPRFHPVAGALQQQRCDLWIFPSPTAKSFQIPVRSLVSIHDLMHRYERRFPESASGWEYYCRERNLTNICRFAAGVLVDSECGRRQVQESYGMSPNRIHVLPYIAPGYIRNPDPPPGFEERYLLPQKFLFYPAQFWQHKNHARLIEAVASLKRELPDLKLVLAGSKKNAYESVLSLVEKLGLSEDVLFLGYVPDEDMPELYRRARGLVMPTYYGPTNIPPLEAFALGCPVAISGIYAMPEQTGGAALLFSPDSTDDIAEAARALWTDDLLCALLARRGKIRAAAWGRKQFNERLHQVVDELCPRSKGAGAR